MNILDYLNQRCVEPNKLTHAYFTGGERDILSVGTNVSRVELEVQTYMGGTSKRVYVPIDWEGPTGSSSSGHLPVRQCTGACVRADRPEFKDDIGTQPKFRVFKCHDPENNGMADVVVALFRNQHIDFDVIELSRDDLVVLSIGQLRPGANGVVRTKQGLQLQSIQSVFRHLDLNGLWYYGPSAKEH